jgi:hypothetical protein
MASIIRSREARIILCGWPTAGNRSAWKAPYNDCAHPGAGVRIIDFVALVTVGADIAVRFDDDAWRGRFVFDFEVIKVFKPNFRGPIQIHWRLAVAT